MQKLLTFSVNWYMFFWVFKVVFHRKKKKTRFWIRLFILYLHAKGAPLNVKNAEVINVFRKLNTFFYSSEQSIGIHISHGKILPRPQFGKTEGERLATKTVNCPGNKNLEQIYENCAEATLNILGSGYKHHNTSEKAVFFT